MEAGYELTTGIPSPEDYLHLRKAAGLSPKSLEGAAMGLPNTLFAVLVRKQAEVVGMGRVVGDGGLFFQVVDIAVVPTHQGKGIGKAIVGRIVEHLKATSPAGAHVSLLADGEAHRLYTQFGFALTAPTSVGMALSLR